MQNGHDHGTPKSAPQVQVDPRQAAQYGLNFLARVSHTRAERDAFDVVEGMLQAIAAGHVVLAPPPALPAPSATPGVVPEPE